MQNVQRSLSNADLKNSDNKYDKEDYLNRNTEDMNKIINKENLGGLLRKYVDIGNEKELNRQIEKDFGVLTDETHNALITSVEDFKRPFLVEKKKLVKLYLTHKQVYQNL